MPLTLQMVLSVHACLQDVLKRRKQFLVGMAEILRRRRAIVAGLQALPHPDPSVAGVFIGDAQWSPSSQYVFWLVFSAQLGMHRSQVSNSRQNLAGHLELNMNPHACCSGLSNNYLRVGEMAERMRNNLDKDHQLVRRFIGGIVHQVGTVIAPSP